MKFRTLTLSIVVAVLLLPQLTFAYNPPNLFLDQVSSALTSVWNSFNTMVAGLFEDTGDSQTAAVFVAQNTPATAPTYTLYPAVTTEKSYPTYSTNPITNVYPVTYITTQAIDAGSLYSLQSQITSLQRNPNSRINRTSTGYSVSYGGASNDVDLTTLSPETFSVTGSATSTFANGINITDGCFAIDDVCLSTSSGGITSLGGQYSTAQTGSAQTFATSTDTNITLAVTSSGNTHTFTPGWTGTLAVSRGGTGLLTTPTYGQLLVGNSSGGYTLTATSSLGISGSQWTTSGSYIYYNTGNVGIGTTSPYAKLSVAGEIVGSYFTGTSTATSTFGGSLGVTGNATLSGKLIINAGSEGSPAITYNTDPTSGLSFLYTGTTVIYLSVGGTSKLSIADGESIFTNQLDTIGGTASTPGIQVGGTSGTGIFSPSTTVLGFSSGSSERMRIDSSGNVGIGTSSPYAKLSVVGEIVSSNFTATSTTATSTISTGGLTVGSTQFTVQQTSGNVGVGTGVPTAGFVVANSAGSLAVGNAFIVTRATQNVVNVPLIGGGNSTEWYFTATQQRLASGFTLGWSSSSNNMGGASLDVGFSRDAARVLRLSDGSTGYGALRVATTTWYSTTGTALGIFDANTGNLGVGTSSPYAKLSVVGEIVGSNFTATSTTATSTFAGDVKITSGAAGYIPLIVQGATSQSGNLTEWRNSAGTSLLRVGSDGFIGNTNIGMYSNGTIQGIAFSSSGGYYSMNDTQQGLQFHLDSQLKWSSAGVGGTNDVGFARDAARVIRVSNGSTGYGGFKVATTTWVNTSGTALGIFDTNTGNFGVGTTTPWRTLSVTGTVAFNGLTSSATGNALCITTGKDITDAGAGTCTPSSLRYKENIETMDEGDALDMISQMRVVDFDYKTGSYSPEDGPHSLGLIAEEVEDIDSRLVDYGYDGQPRTLHFERLTGLTVQAIQELHLKIEDLATSSAVMEQNDSMFDWILSKFESATARISSLFVKELHVEDKVCADDVCITKEQFKKLLLKAGGESEPGGETGDDDQIPQEDEIVPVAPDETVSEEVKEELDPELGPAPEPAPENVPAQ